MKKLFLLGIAFCLVTSFAFAQEATTTATTTTEASAPEAAEMTITGTIIDNQCASAQKPEELDSFIKKHTKQCALMPTCAASGYSIYADGQLSRFDKESNTKVLIFLEKADSNLNVRATVKKVGDELSLVYIENQK